MSNLKKSALYGIAGLAVTGAGYMLNQFLKKHKTQREYSAVCALLGDVGGTNIRLELVMIKPPLDQPVQLFKKRTYPVASYQSLIDAIKEFLAAAEVYPDVAVIGIAGPVAQDKITMANVLKWGQMASAHFGTQLGIKDFKFINDFEAISYGLLLLKQDDFVSINGKSIDEEKTRGVIGPGTGLGTSVLFTSPFRKRHRVYVLPSEGGHTDFCYIDSQTCEFFQFMKQKTGHQYISRERSFCGPAIPHMFRYFAGKFPDLPDAEKFPTSEEILIRCREEEEKLGFEPSLYHKTLQLFIKLYANAIGNFMAHHMCSGGMYLVGGLTNAVLPFLKDKNLITPFLQRHPEIASTLQKIPIVVSKQVDLGLKGAYVYARRIISDEQHE